MGTYLSKPVTDKDSSEGENEQFRYGVSAMQGWRSSMEDAHATVLNVSDAEGQDSTIGFFGVFDGHGGKEVALFAAKHLTSVLVRTEAWKAGDLEKAITQAYLQLDASLGREELRDELVQLARSKNEDSAIDLSQGLQVIPPAVREAIAMRYKDFEAEAGEWSGDEFEDPAFDPLTDLDESKGGKIGDEDIMTRGDSDEEGGEEVMEEEASEQPEETGGLEEADEGCWKIALARFCAHLPSAETLAKMAERKRAEEQSTDSGEGAEPSNRQSEAPFHLDPGSQRRGYQGPSAGCTAVVALVAKDKLIVANAGDSRCVASRDGVAHAMTHDHKPTDDEESARIFKAGGFIAEGRVNGSLNLSRAFGDMEFKRSSNLSPAQQMITANPEVRTLQLQRGDEFLILACDGIWDVLTNQAAVDFVREGLKRGLSPKAVCEAMCDKCLAPNVEGCGEGCDNMSAMVVVLKSFVAEETLKGATPVPAVMPAPTVAP